MMAKRACLTNKALNFLYKIRTSEFSKSPAHGNADAYGWNYSVDLNVDKHPEYPDIPPSTWTITLSLGLDGTDIGYLMEPKGGRESVMSPRLVLMDSHISQGQLDWEDVENVDRDHWGYLIGPEGFEHGDPIPISDLVKRQPVPFRTEKRSDPAVLMTGPEDFVVVNLTFIVEQTTTGRGLGTLYESDGKLICDGREFPVHRAILAAQSPVFKDLFLGGMDEIRDVSADVLDALLQFVYTGEVTKADGQLEALWNAAAKYDMADLKVECECLMVGSLNDRNAADALYFALPRGMKRLKVEAAKMVAQEEI